MEIKTVTIGIPAYNEERNILLLIQSVLKQKMAGFKIEKIIVSSDGSSDNTVSLIKSMKNKMVKVYENRDRKGVARGLNQIIENTNTDVLVTIDADIFIKENNFIQNLINPIIKDNVDHTSSAIMDVDNKTYFSCILSNSMKLKEILFSVIKNGNNVYNCKGLARGYSNRFYKGIRFPLSIGNDVYSYLFAVKNGYSFKYIKTTIAYYKLPSTLKDHMKQSSRFFSTSLLISKCFNRDFVNKELEINSLDYIKASVLAIPILINNPLKSFAYFIIQLFISYKVSVNHERNQPWDLAYSTK